MMTYKYNANGGINTTDGFTSYPMGSSDHAFLKAEEAAGRITIAPYVDGRFYIISPTGEAVSRPMDYVRRWMKKQIREQAREITNRTFKRFGDDVVYVLDKFVDLEADAKPLTEGQKTKMRDAVQRLRRLTRLDNDVSAREAAIDALADIPAAQAYVGTLDVSEAGDVEDNDLV